MSAVLTPSMCKEELQAALERLHDKQWQDKFPNGMYYILCAPVEEELAALWRAPIRVGWIGERPLAARVPLYIPARAIDGPYAGPMFTGRRYMFSKREVFEKHAQSILSASEMKTFLEKIDSVRALAASA